MAITSTTPPVSPGSFNSIKRAAAAQRTIDRIRARLSAVALDGGEYPDALKPRRQGDTEAQSLVPAMLESTRLENALQQPALVALGLELAPTKCERSVET